MLIKIRKKQILLPETKIFEGDKRADTLVFCAERYWENIDLSTLNAYVKVSAPNFCDKILLSAQIKTKEITLEWVMPEAVTAKEGEMKIQLVFESENVETVINTDIVSLRIGESIDMDKEIVQIMPSIIGELQSAQIKLISSFQELSDKNALKADKEYVDGVLDQKADKQSLPIALSELDNDIGYLTETDINSILEEEIAVLFGG